MLISNGTGRNSSVRARKPAALPSFGFDSAGNDRLTGIEDDANEARKVEFCPPLKKKLGLGLSLLSNEIIPWK